MELTRPALAILWTNVLQILGVIIFVMISNMTAQWKMFWIFVVLVTMSIGAFLMTWVVQCVVTGGCNVLAWLLVSLLIIYFVIALLSAIAYYNSGYKITMTMPNNLVDAVTEGPNFSVEEQERHRRRNEKHRDEDDETHREYHKEVRRRDYDRDDSDDEDDDRHRR